MRCFDASLDASIGPKSERVRQQRRGEGCASDLKLHGLGKPTTIRIQVNGERALPARSISKSVTGLQNRVVP